MSPRSLSAAGFRPRPIRTTGACSSTHQPHPPREYRYVALRDERDARTASLRLGSRPMDTDVSHVQIGTLASGEELWLSPEARARHVLLIGATGTGKTTLLRHLMLSDIYAGAGFALIDPHGDIAIEIADSIPPELTGRAVYFNPADLSHPIGFNPVERVPIDQRPLRAAHIIATFEHRWRDSWGPRMSYILQNAVRLLLDAPGVTLLGPPAPPYRRDVSRPASQNLCRSGYPALLGS